MAATDSNDPSKAAEPVRPIDTEQPLPENERHYIGIDDEEEEIKAGHHVYTGDRGGLYIPITGHVAKHKEANEAVAYSFAGNELSLHPAPNHGPDEFLYEIDGVKSWHLASNAPTRISTTGKSKGKTVKAQPKKDKNRKTIARRHGVSLLNGSRALPPNALDVHISSDKDAIVQAVYKTSENGRKFAIKTPEEVKRLESEKWKKFARHRSAIETHLKALGEMDIKDMSAAAKVIYVAGLTGIRHGSENEPRTGSDGLPTGEGLLTLRVSSITELSDTHVKLNFRGKHDRDQEFTYTDPKLIAIFKEAKNNSLGGAKKPTDRIFDKQRASTNNEYLKVETKKILDLDEGNENKTAAAQKKNRGVVVKNLRTLVGTAEAEKLVKEEMRSITKPLNENEFKALQERVGLKVGIKLGHKIENPKLKDEEGNHMLDDKGEPQYADGIKWRNHHKEAIESYIAPTTWNVIDRELTKALPSTDEMLRQMQKAIQDLQKAITPDWHMKGPNEERDIDEWAEARQRKGENRAFGFKQPNGRPHKGTLKLAVPTTKTWMDSLNEQGFLAPIIKGVNPEGTRMWIESGGQQFVAFLGMNGSARVEKATFKAVTDPRRKPTVRTAVPTPDMDEMDDSPERGI
jgi:hypothetical protein